LFNSCHRRGVNPLAWATDVLGKLQEGWPRDRLEELLPNAWVKSTSPELIEQAEAA
jgi:transposase